MRKYEAVIIVVPEVGEEGLQQVAERFGAMVKNSGGNVQVLRSLGRRTLAYRIAAYEEGIYVLMQFSCEPSIVDVLRRELRLSEQIIRSLIVRLEEGVALKEEALAEDEKEQETAPTEVAVASPEGLEDSTPEPDASLSQEGAATLEPEPLEASEIPNAQPAPEPSPPVPESDSPDVEREGE